MEKEVHNFFHKNDFHCNVSDKHFHQEEHHCNLCDFTNDVLESQAIFHHNILIHELGLLNYFFPSGDIILQKEVFRPLRAPPVLV